MTEFHLIGKTTVSVSDYHHEVIRHWSKVKNDVPDVPLAVLTLDHHTDVVQAFRGNEDAVENAWKDPAAVEDAVMRLKHDEHIDWAVKTGMISSAFVIAHVNMTLPADNRIKVLYDEKFPDEFVQLNEPETFFPFASKVLDDTFLEPLLNGISLGKYILDIDCDNFLCRAALFPERSAVWKKLIKNACAVTVSKESDYVRLLRLKGENITADDIVSQLLRLFEELLT